MKNQPNIDDIRLYTDLCNAHGFVPDITSLTRRQVELLVSLRNNGLRPVEYEQGRRCWRFTGTGNHKKRQGGNLTQRFGLKFFFSEKS